MRVVIIPPRCIWHMLLATLCAFLLGFTCGTGNTGATVGNTLAVLMNLFAAWLVAKDFEPPDKCMFTRHRGEVSWEVEQR